MMRPKISPPARENARVVSIPSDRVTSIAAARDSIPDPETLEPGQLVVVLPDPSGEKSLATSVLSVLGRKKTVPRALRCSALVARGYVDVGAGIDPATKEDLVWASAPARSPII